MRWKACMPSREQVICKRVLIAARHQRPGRSRTGGAQEMDKAWNAR